MAHFSSGSYGSNKGKIINWPFFIVFLIIVTVIVVLIWAYNPFGEKERKEGVDNSKKETEPPAVVSVEMSPKAKEIDKPKVEEPKVEEPNEQVAELIMDAVACINAQPPRIIEARDRLNELLSKSMSEKQRMLVKEQLSSLAAQWLFSPRLFPQDELCTNYTVNVGDQLRTIAMRFKVPYEILMEINNIRRAELLQAGSTIKVIKGPFNAKVYLSAFKMDLYLQDTFVRSFEVGIGKPGRETPTGLWVVEEGGKLIKPGWTDPDTGRRYEPDDPDYPLGSRWIELKGIEGDAVGRTGIAFHGTKDANGIGTAGSRGCIRLHNGDVITVYNLLVPVYSQVRVSN